MAVLCGMPTIQYSAPSTRLSVPLSNFSIMFSWNQMICTSPHLYLQHEKGADTPYQSVPSGKSTRTSGYATMVHGRGCNPHRSTTFANLEITSLWRHWWRYNSETIRDREKRRPPRAMKSSELSNGENRIALKLLQNRKWRQWWRQFGFKMEIAKNGSREF